MPTSNTAAAAATYALARRMRPRKGRLSENARPKTPTHSAPNSVGSARLNAISGMIPVSLISTATRTRPK